MLNSKQKEIAEFIYEKHDIRPWDVKVEFTVTNRRDKPLLIKRKCTQFEFELLDICYDTDFTFVINPDSKLETTANGGTAKILILPKGYKLHNEHESTNKGPFGEITVTIKEIGFKGTLDNLSQKGFKFNLGKLTHDHLVLVINPRPERKKFYSSAKDEIEMEIDYLTLMKSDEKNILEAIKMENFRKSGPKGVGFWKTILCLCCSSRKNSQ